MSWRKLQRIFIPKNNHHLLLSHASNPTPYKLDRDVYRVFYNGRDVENKSSIGFFDFDLITKSISNITFEPVATFGESNSYTSHGLSNGCFLEIDGNVSLLCMAWQIRGGGHWRGDIASVKLNRELIKGSTQTLPFLGVDLKTDLVSLSYPWILRENSMYKMWYGSTISWDSPNGEMIHVINYATSTNGLDWERHGLAIPYEIGVAQAFSRPTVIKDDKGYHMWFSYRSGDGTPYRIGYAFSTNGLDWELRLKDAGIDVSSKGWDSEMICYPYVFEHSGERYMLYNGNSYGMTGVGLAIWEK